MGQTPFTPEEHGFQFANTFRTRPIADVTLAGLCGGMSYTALDYYFARSPIPPGSDRPADGTPLAAHIYQRHEQSVLANVDKWLELMVNPGGVRNGEFFRWGLQQTGGGRLQELRQKIDSGTPVPLGLFSPKDGGTPTNHHQVVGIGYELGRYDGTAYPEDVRVIIYNPNHPGETRRLMPDLGAQLWREDCGQCEWRTYFVDSKYVPAAVPAVPPQQPAEADRVNEVRLTVLTGSDDLRGGNDNVNVTITLADGRPVRRDNVNGGARWIDHYDQTVVIPIDPPVHPQDIRAITLETTFRGGFGGDNWNIDELRVSTPAGPLWASERGDPLHRFTGENRTKTFYL